MRGVGPSDGRRVPARPVLGGLAACGFLLLASAAPAHAAIWFAAPGGDGPDPCRQADPCDIHDAVGHAPSGTRVAALSGTYEITSALHVENGIILQGPYSGPAAIVEGNGTSGPAVRVTGDQTRVADLSIRQTSFGDGIEVGDGGLADRLDSTTSGSGAGCAPVIGGMLRDSVCASYGSGNGVIVDEDSAAAGKADLTNVTAISAGDGASAGAILVRASNGADLDVEAGNVIAYAMGDAPDVVSGALAGSNADLTMLHSNYDTVATVGPGTATPPGANGNQTDVPAFTDAPGGDFSAAPGSPTIDSGSDEAGSLGLLDIVRRARIRDAGPDIGAHEFVPPPDTRPPNVSIPVAPKGRIKTSARFVDVTFELASDEDDVTFECRINRLPVETCSSPVSYRLDSARGPGASYKLTVRAIDAAGNRSGRAIRQVQVIRVRKKGRS